MVAKYKINANVLVNIVPGDGLVVPGDRASTCKMLTNLVFHMHTRPAFEGYHGRSLHEYNTYLRTYWNKNTSKKQPFWFNITGVIGQYHGYWCPGSLRRQGISSHGIYDVGYRCCSCISEQIIPKTCVI